MSFKSVKLVKKKIKTNKQTNEHKKTKFEGTRKKVRMIPFTRHLIPIQDNWRQSRKIHAVFTNYPSIFLGVKDNWSTYVPVKIAW